MRFRSQPPAWNSVHRPVRYVLEADFLTCQVVNDGSGGLEVSSYGQMNYVINVGDQVYIGGTTLSGTDSYIGLHTVTEIVTYNFKFKVSGTYDGSDATYSLFYVMYIPPVSIYKGHTSSDPYPTQLPYEKIATFTPEYTFDDDLEKHVASFDISGYLQSIFDIQPPVLDGIDFNMFNKFRIIVEIPSARVAYGFRNRTSYSRNVLNSAIKTSVLNSDFLNTDRYLSPEGDVPYLFTCGKSIFSKLKKEFVLNQTFSPDIPVSCDFNNDFNNDFLIC